jgi:uncharacterized protein (DUF302 family)
MTTDLQPVAFALPGPATGGFQRATVLARSIDDVVDRLKQCIEAEDLWVLHEINPQMLLERGGYAIAAVRQVLFFHPRLMVRVISADRAALLEAPLKFAAIGVSDGQSELRWIDPEPVFARYGSPQLAALGQELSTLQQRIADAVAETERTVI